jgi:hypothetical protein
MCDLQTKSRKEISLAIIKPRDIDFKVTETDRDWGGDHKILLHTNRLDGQIQKYLTKIPYKFYYKYNV